MAALVPVSWGIAGVEPFVARRGTPAGVGVGEGCFAGEDYVGEGLGLSEGSTLVA